MKIDWKKMFPHLIAIGIFLIVSMAYFYPALQGYELKTHDVKMWKGMSKEIADFRENNNEEAMWTNSMFGGMPATQISIVYPNNLMSYVYKVITLNLPKPINMVWMYFIGFYIFLMCLKIDPWIAIVGSIAFGFSSYFFVILEAGHITKAMAIAFMAPTIGGIILTYRGKILLGAAVTALFMSLELLSNHYQITYYMFLIVLFYGISEIIRFGIKKEWFDFIKRSAVIIAAISLALLVNLGNIWGTSEYTKYTTRGKSELTQTSTGIADTLDKTTGLDRSYITAWSYGKGETFTLLIPDTKGGGSVPMHMLHKNNVEVDAVKAKAKSLKMSDASLTQSLQQIPNEYSYWGNQGSTSGPVYVGSIIILLCLLSIPFVKNKMIWALFAVTFLAVFLSWGKYHVSMLVLLPILFMPLVVLAKEKLRPILFAGMVLALVIIVFNGDSMLSYLAVIASISTVAIFGESKTKIIIGSILTAIGTIWLFTKGMALGDMSLTNFFLDYVPGYNKFRAVTMILVVVELTIPFLAILYLKQLITRRKEVEQKINWFYIVAGGLVLSLLVIAAMPETFFNFFPNGQGELTQAFLSSQYPEMEVAQQMQIMNFYNTEYYPLLKQVRIGIFTEDLFRSLGFIVVAVGLIYLFIKEKIKYPILIGSIGVLVFIDMAAVNYRYLNNDAGQGTDKFQSWVEKDANKTPFFAYQGDFDILMNEIGDDAELMQEISQKVDAAKQASDGPLNPGKEQAIWFDVLNANTNYRVFTPNNPFNETRTSYFHKSIGGYHGAKLKRYQELIEFHIGRNNQKVLDMLNTKYIIQSGKDQQGNIGSNMIPRNSALGNAWFVNDVKMVENADQEILALADAAGFDPANIVVVDKKYNDLVGGEFVKDVNGSIELINYEPNHLIYNFNASSNQLVVFSEIFYDLGWQAYIDGASVDHFGCNYVLRGLRVPEGEHKIEFKYGLKSYEVSSIVSLIASIVILLALGLVLWLHFSTKTKAKYLL